MKFSFYLITFFSFLKFVNSSTRKISEINYASFKKYINENKKLLILFYIENCIFCEQAVKTIENEIINYYDDESGIIFGKINVDSENMLSHKFKIKKIPSIILIQGEYFYELNQKPDKYSIKDLIDLPKDNAKGKKIPEHFNIIEKILNIIDMTVNFIIKLFYSMLKISLNKNIIISILIVIFFSFLWLIQKLLCFICCCKFCRKCKYKKKNQIYKFDEENSQISKEEIDKESSEISGDDNVNKVYEIDNNNTLNKNEINEIFNGTISEEQILKKEKND
jgi:hypothetical protein